MSDPGDDTVTADVIDRLLDTFAFLAATSVVEVFARSVYRPVYTATFIFLTIGSVVFHVQWSSATKKADRAREKLDDSYEVSAAEQISRTAISQLMIIVSRFVSTIAISLLSQPSKGDSSSGDYTQVVVQMVHLTLVFGAYYAFIASNPGKKMFSARQARRSKKKASESGLNSHAEESESEVEDLK